MPAMRLRESPLGHHNQSQFYFFLWLFFLSRGKVNDANHRERCHPVALKQATVRFVTKAEGITQCQIRLSTKTSFWLYWRVLLTTSAVNMLNVHHHNRKLKCKTHFPIKKKNSVSSKKMNKRIEITCKKYHSDFLKNSKRKGN